MRKDENGLIVAEALISFTAFIMVCLGIVFMINIFMLHNKVQFAINSAAREIASYAYVYDALSMRDAEMKVNMDGSEFTTPINEAAENVIDTVNQVQSTFSELGDTKEAVESFDFTADEYNDIKSQLDSLKDSVDDTVESGKKTYASLQKLDAKTIMAGMIYISAEAGMDTVKAALGEAAARALTKNYIETAEKSADDYLKAYGVEGYDALDFGNTTIFCDDYYRLIDIVVEYDIDLSFLSFVLSNTTVHAVQRVSVAAWCGGDDQKVTRQGDLYTYKS